MSLTARDIRLSIGGKAILDGLQLDADPGEVTAIVGPNGSGKSTLLRVLTGEETASGLVRLNGLDVTRKRGAPLAAMRGVLPQSSGVAFPFKVAEILRIGHRAGIHAAQTDIPDRALELVGLAGFGDRFYQELSGGEQQRVQLARVLAQVWQPVTDGRPNWLFLDEPVASLDIGHQLTIMRLARDYARRGGGVIAVMHDLNLTAMFADRIAVLKSGRFLAQGKPAEVLTDNVLTEAYGCPVRASTPPGPDIPFILPQAAGAA